MKKLYYNPFEVPQGVRIKSKCFEIDIEYKPEYSDGKPIFFESLFELAKSECFESIQVYVTPHEQAYYRDTRDGNKKVDVTGWIELKEFRKGGGYMQDKTELKYK